MAQKVAGNGSSGSTLQPLGPRTLLARESIERMPAQPLYLGSNNNPCSGQDQQKFYSPYFGWDVHGGRVAFLGSMSLQEPLLS